VQAGCHRRQRDVHHGHVQDDHELSAQHDGEGDVPPVAVPGALAGARERGGDGRRRHGSFPERKVRVDRQAGRQRGRAADIGRLAIWMPLAVALAWRLW
jgi:hypothetical protein